MKRFLHRSFGGSTNDSRKMRCSGLSLFGISILALLALTGCALSMVSPCEWGPVFDKTKPVQFTGGAQGAPPNTLITIQACNPQDKNWYTIGETTSQAWTGVHGDLPPSYFWVTNLVIPNQYWAEGQECASTGESALVRSKWGGGDIPSVTKDWPTCLANNPSTFPGNCLAPESPNVRVGSLNYRDLGKECGDLINQIRAIEGKSSLEIGEAGECEADCHAQCNYDWELTHPNEWHRCKPWEQHQCNFPTTLPAAQNECPVYSSIGSILSNCIWQQMYLNEKQCYLKNPPSSSCATDGCYYDTSCMCGHYVNMVICPNYGKVSCGLYKTPNGSFKSVQNFE